MDYAELQTATAFSFLHGASHAEELVQTAASLGLSAIGITDRNTVAGVVRAHAAAKRIGLRILPGSRLVFRDGTPDILCYPTDRAAWGRLCRVLTIGKLRTTKGDCHLDFSDLSAHAEGQILIVVPPASLDSAFHKATLRIATDHRGSAYLAATRLHGSNDARRLRTLSELTASCRIKLVATNDVQYHAAERRPLQDVMTCVRLHTTIDAAGLAIARNAERHLKPPQEMARLFRAHPTAIECTQEIVQRCRFSLDDLAYEYPDEPVPKGATPDSHLATLTHEGAATRYPGGMPEKVAATIEKELRVIAQLGYARYFLTVHDIVRFARSRGILCQGRGSAANSAVCYCIGVTAVDPAQIDLLFERFVSAERQEPPDIDVDFEHERREEVIQYIYTRYGRSRAGIAATVIHYRPKLAIREVGRTMGLPEDVTAALAGLSWNAGDIVWPDDRVREIGLDPEAKLVQQTVALAREMVGFPRHLSQHVGGFVLTRGPLDEMVPIGPAAMAGRTFIEWDKDDIDALGIMKVDVLALGMLTCIHRSFDLLNEQKIMTVRDMADIPREDPAVYRMLQRGDSLGVFQVESRAQMNMLPRLKPATFYDLVIEVAIVRPGPIQGDMVHPYLRRRQGREAVQFPSPAPEHGPKDELQRVLGRTLGVPLFQEQAMRIAIDAARFTPEEANQLRRSMATFRHVGTIHSFFAKMVDGMAERGYERDFAERCFRQIEGFGTYGFPESHAASFALLVYVSAWLKCHHPAIFACALLNSQPMGFYAPAQIIRDAREHGADVREVDVNDSSWDCGIEADGALRLGLCLLSGFQRDWAQTLTAAQPYRSFDDLASCGLPQAALVALAEADALRSIGLDRRMALWAALGDQNQAMLPLLTKLPRHGTSSPLPTMSLLQHVAADYQFTGVSLKAHPLRFLRTELTHDEISTCVEATSMRNGAKVRLAGLVLVRQRPGTAKGVVFITIEDETGTANIVVWAKLLTQFRREVLNATLLVIDGHTQRSEEGVVHVIADRLTDRSTALNELDTDNTITVPPARADELPRHLPASRDFK